VVIDKIVCIEFSFQQIGKVGGAAAHAREHAAEKLL
jgi:hypothetical protein